MRTFLAMIGLAIVITGPAEAALIDLTPLPVVADQAHLDLIATKKKKRRTRGFSGGIAKHRTETEDGSCKCAGSKVCIGPRGGRYCITSGGKKRYV